MNDEVAASGAGTGGADGGGFRGGRDSGAGGGCRRRTRTFATIEQAVADIAAGRAVVVVDDEDRENEGDLIFAAEMATPELVAFMVRYTSGFICVPLTEADVRPARPAADVPHQPGPQAAPRTP